MASSNTHDISKSEPLTPAKPTNQKPVPETLATTALYATKFFGYSRVILGAGSLLAPRFTCGLFRFLISNETATVVRLFGIRGIALGELLLTAEDKTLADGGRREVRRALWANLACDVLDICSLAFAIYNGHIGWVPGALLAEGAAMLIGVGTIGLKAV